jgi:hypothetical protein
MHAARRNVFDYAMAINAAVTVVTPSTAGRLHSIGLARSSSAPTSTAPPLTVLARLSVQEVVAMVERSEQDDIA